MKKLLFSCLCWLCLFMPAPANASANDIAPKTTYVATTTHIADMLRQIVGDRATIITLMGPGLDPHTYQLTRSDMANMLKANAVFYNGLLLEGRLARAIYRLQIEKKPILAVAETLPTDLLRKANGDFPGAYDPHIWMNPILWARIGENVAQFLGEQDPKGRNIYQANARLLSEQLQKLSDEMRTAIEALPPEKRVLVTAHDAFGYLGDAFGLEVHGLQGLSTESESGIASIDNLVQLLVDKKVPAVFVESSVPERGLKAVIEAAAAKGQNVVVGGTLYSDALGEPGSAGENYIGMMRHNLRTITEGLSGKINSGQ